MAVCRRVTRLVEAKIAAARKPHGGQEAPSRIGDGAACDPLLAESRNLRLHVIAHEIKLVFAVALRGMAGNLGRRSGKDQPATASVNGGKAEHVAEENAVRLGIARIDDGMHPWDHDLLRCFSASRIQAARPGPRGSGGKARPEGSREHYAGLGAP